MIVNILNKKSFSSLPSTTGIYLFRKDALILYIGKSVNLRARLISHLENSRLDVKENKIISSSNNLQYIIVDSEYKALLLEAKLIRKYRPKYNVVWKDDKSNLYIKITNKEKYPKVSICRKEDDKKSIYIGPFPSVTITEKILREIRRIIPFCSQSKISKSSCFYSKINLCSPCPNEIEKTDDPIKKQQLIKLYKNNIGQIIKLLSGNPQLVLRSLNKQLKLVSQTKQYEEAILIRNRLFTLENFLHRQLPKEYEYQINQSSIRLDSLKNVLNPYFHYSKTIKRIECYDISNLNYKEATGSMVVFINGLPIRNLYRKFKIKNTDHRSDPQMLSEVILRRMTNNDWEKPDLIVVDGGRPQLKAITMSSIPLIGLAKNPDRLIIGINKLPSVPLKYNHPGFQLIKLIRDESHRFARKYHLLLRHQKY